MLSETLCNPQLVFQVRFDVLAGVSIGRSEAEFQAELKKIKRPRNAFNFFTSQRALVRFLDAKVSLAVCTFLDLERLSEKVGRRRESTLCTNQISLSLSYDDGNYVSKYHR